MHLIERQLQNAVNKLVSWCDKNGHTLSPEKSRCVHFCRKRQLHPEPVINIRGTVIPSADEIRFLGVIFDRKLTFLPHVLHLRERCEKSLNILKVLSNTSWGADRTSLLRIYQAVILSRIDYGCMVYGSARPSVLRKLDTIHHSALRICSGAFRTSPVESLYAICSQLPLNLRRKKIAAQYYFRILSAPKHPVSHLCLPVGLRRLYDARSSHIPPFNERVKAFLHDSGLTEVLIQPINFYSFPPWDVPQFSFLNPFSGYDKSTTAPIIFQQLFHYHRCQYYPYTEVFTDGSKSNQHVGSGVVFPSETYSYRLPTSFSVFTAELIAIACALQLISASSNRTFCIYTDSISALRSLDNFNNLMHPVAMEILILLRDLEKRGAKISFCWVPSHVGIPGNEMADIAAKTASSLLQRELPYDDAKKYFANHVRALWQQSWEQQTSNKLHSVDPMTSLWPVIPVRGLDVKLTRLRIGHARFSHKHLLFGEQCPSCPKCHVILTVKHVLIECPNFNPHRLKFFNSLSIELREIVGESPHPNIFKFLHNIGFLHSI
ncbi:uncharacterized protein LOC129969047 [Argiope bruennichi]|uniref:uncharacterized protein LOC129969047 n=1 Tax=Argiope bruennichi TaxID=94029 RepID=UPI0024945AEF|nr:uncharacterized protein LOC129969047 [Argiope bruennichi]